MSETNKTQFLDRASYRKKRLIDVSRLLPLLGALGFIMPPVYLFIAPDGTGSPGITTIYLFVFWLGLILFAALLAPKMQERSNSD